MTAPLTGTVALITEASSAIGAAIARLLAAEGPAVAQVARRRDRLEARAATMRSATSFWNISTMRPYQGGQGSLSSQPISSTVATL